LKAVALKATLSVHFLLSLPVLVAIPAELILFAKPGPGAAEPKSVISRKGTDARLFHLFALVDFSKKK
jgi:hypothetical protein